MSPPIRLSWTSYTRIQGSRAVRQEIKPWSIVVYNILQYIPGTGIYQHYTSQRRTHQTWANLALLAASPFFVPAAGATDTAVPGRVVSGEGWTCTMSPQCDSARRNRFSIEFRQRRPPASTSVIDRRRARHVQPRGGGAERNGAAP